jgi:hypothetical protein
MSRAGHLCGVTQLAKPDRTAVRLYAAIALVAVAAHGSALLAGWVWLDHAHIEQGLAWVPLRRAWTAFTQGFAETSYYRPLMTLSLSVDAAITSARSSGVHAAHPLWFHAVSLAWHAAAAVMVAAAARVLTDRRHAWWLAGVLFAAHPVTSVVANAIAFRSEAMMTTGLLGLIVAHTNRRAGWAAACILLAGLSKETGLVMAPLVLATLHVTRRQHRPQGTRTLWLVETGAWLAAVTLRWVFAPGWHASHPRLAWDTAIGSRLATITESAQRILVAGDRTVCDVFPITSWSHPTAWAGATLLALWLYAMARGCRRCGGGCMLAMLALLPALQPVPVMRWWSPHYVYLPWAFGAMCVARFAARFERAGVATATLLCAALATVSFHDGLRFQNDETLWRAEVDANPYCLEGAFYLGEHERHAGNYAQAEQWYEQALRPPRGHLAYVDTVAALQNLGAVRLELGRYDDALAALERARALNRNPRRAAELTHNAALSALLDGRADKAWELIGGRCRDPRVPQHTLVLCAKTLYALGRHAESFSMLRRITRQ